MAFTAENRSQVDEFYRRALSAGGKDNGPPGIRPNYHANYYAAFVIGPDGHNVEAVCHRPGANPAFTERTVDHDEHDALIIAET
jgi:predicted lactoylglutathione lyase